MTLIDIMFVLGVVLTIFGIAKRKAPRGKWILAAGITVMAVAFVLSGYADIKAGFFDALAD